MHFAICQNWCFGRFHRSRIEVLQIAQVLAIKADDLVTMVSAWLRTHNMRAEKKAVTETVPNLIWGPDFFGPLEI